MSDKRSGSPRKFAEKIALLNKNEAEANAKFDWIIKEVEQTTTRKLAPSPSRSSSGSSSWLETRLYDESQQPHSIEYMPLSNEHPLPSISHQPPSLQLHPHPPQQQQPLIEQRQQQHLIEQPQINPVTVDTPIGVPNIAIFPIEDDVYQHQSQQQVTTAVNYLNDCSNPITEARSLPDIANLRVTSSCAGAATSYSQEGLTEYQGYGYDTNSNIVENHVNIQGRNYCDQTSNEQIRIHQSHQSQQHHHHHQYQQPQSLQPNHPPAQLQANSNWTQTNFHLNTHHNDNSQTQSLHQNYYQQSNYQPGPMVRASSTNTVLTTNWPNNDSARMNNNLSRSSDVYYRIYPNGYQSDNCYANNDDMAAASTTITPTFTNQSYRAANSIMRSNSFGDIENYQYHQQDDKLNSLPHQQAFLLSSQLGFYK